MMGATGLTEGPFPWSVRADNTLGPLRDLLPKFLRAPKGRLSVEPSTLCRVPVQHLAEMRHRDRFRAASHRIAADCFQGLDA